MNGSPSVKVALFIRNGGSESPCRWFYITGIYIYNLKFPTETIHPYNFTIEAFALKFTGYFFCILRRNEYNTTAAIPIFISVLPEVEK